MLVSSALLFLSYLSFAIAYPIHYITPSETKERFPAEEGFQIFCYAGKPKNIIHLWQTVNLQILIANDKYEVYEAANASSVTKEYLEHRSSWRINLFSWKLKNFHLDPFGSSCIGIESGELYRVRLNVIRIDYWKVLKLVIGIALFLSAPQLCRNTLFYYITGITFGICASFLILIYFLSRFFPRRPMMYGVAICGWTVAIYLLQMLWDNVRVILSNYQSHIAVYALVTGLLSFVVCYRMGPVSNQRTLNLIQWTLQSVAIVLIFFSSEYQEVAMSQIILLGFFYNFPRALVNKSRAYLKKRFPPKLKVISNEQYYQQGVVETKKALDSLRKFCSSPECNQWKLVSCLNDSKRFASFIEGQSHLSDNEVLEYETSINPEDFSDDEETSEGLEYSFTDDE